MNFQGAPDYDIANGIYGSQDLRTSAIKGHELYTDLRCRCRRRPRDA